MASQDNQPVFVAAFTASRSGSYFGLKATVKALSTMRPPICVPKSAEKQAGSFQDYNSMFTAGLKISLEGRCRSESYLPLMQTQPVIKSNT